MHYLEAELSMVDKRHGGEFANEEEEGKTHGRKIMDKKLKKHVELVEKVINLSIPIRIVFRWKKGAHFRTPTFLHFRRNEISRGGSLPDTLSCKVFITLTNTSISIPKSCYL